MNIRFTIKSKILFGFCILIAILLGIAVYTIITISDSEDTVKESVVIISPTLDALNEFVLLANRSKMLATNWVYLQTNTEDKEALKSLHEYEYPELKNRLENLIELNEMKNEDNTENKDDVTVLSDSVFIQFETLLGIERELMASLQTFEDYEDPIKKFMAEEIISEQVIPSSDEIIRILKEDISNLQKQKEQFDIQMVESFKSLRNTVIGILLISLVVGMAVALYIISSITKPLNYLRGIIEKLSKGFLVTVENKNLTNDELGDMAKSVEQLVISYTESAKFADNIGNGNYDSDFKPLSEEDVLGNALQEMRNNLKRVAEEDKRRNWSNIGMAKFGEILRSHGDSFEAVSDDIITNLVNYVDANQGALFVVQEDDIDSHLKMVSCYAWNKKKYFERKVYKGEGLTGQCWIEGDPIYITDVPDDYVEITSGLGGANPTSVFIVPLIINEEIFGVLEIASFHEIEEYQREFILRLSESIASTISFLKSNEKTQKLLKESTMMTEQMRAQEEEMRQNMEELQATQEKIQRDSRDRDVREKIIRENSVVLEMSAGFIIQNASGRLNDFYGYYSIDLEGRSFKELVSNASVLKEISYSVGNEGAWTGILNIQEKSGEYLESWCIIGLVPDDVNGGDMYLLYASVLSNAFDNVSED